MRCLHPASVAEDGKGGAAMSRAAMQQALDAIEGSGCKADLMAAADALRAALAEQSQPLTDEEILSLVGWERAEMYMKLTPKFPVDEAKQETLKNFRAVEAEVLKRVGAQR